MIESVELRVAFLHDVPPLRGLRTAHRGTWDEPDGGCDRWALEADPVENAGALEYDFLLPPEDPGRWALGVLDRDWKEFRAGCRVLYPLEFFEWSSNRFWVFPVRDLND